jgi:hypothetical protein
MERSGQDHVVDYTEAEWVAVGGGMVVAWFGGLVLACMSWLAVGGACVVLGGALFTWGMATRRARRTRTVHAPDPGSPSPLAPPRAVPGRPR